MNKQDYAKARLRLVNWLKSQLIGPATQDNNGDLVGIKPSNRYPIGVLYPVDSGGKGLDPACEDTDDVTSNTAEGGEDDEVFVKRRYVPPSSVGFSFYVASDVWQLQIIVKASRYLLDDNLDLVQEGIVKKDRLFADKSEWVFNREQLGGEDKAITVNAQGEYPVFYTTVNGDTRPLGSVSVLEYEHDDGYNTDSDSRGKIITVSLINKQSIEDDNQKDASWQRVFKSLFEVSLECYIEQGVVGEYPDVSYEDLSREYQELHLQYQYKKVYAIGHGAAVDWQIQPQHSQHDNLEHKIKNTQNNFQNQTLPYIYTDFLPVYEVPNVTAKIATDTQSQNLDASSINSSDPNPTFLNHTANDLDVLKLSNLANTMQKRAQVCAALHTFVDGYEHWIAKQQSSVDSFDNVKQQVGNGIIERMHVAQARMRQGIDLLSFDDTVAQAFAFSNQAMMQQMRQSGIDAPEWRAFQLAFILLSIASCVDEYDDYRQEVDLIWFPTGGGKTEAYLGVAAFMILWRRLNFSEQSSGGTVCLMRYTLKLLTTQQFMRACRLICALELLRREHPQLGSETISIGLWVGGSSSPNTLYAATEIVNKIKRGKHDEMSQFVLTACPWCQAPLDDVSKNIAISTTKFEFYCHNKHCEYGAQHIALPCQVIDEVLYLNPPTLIVGTLDKFAMLAWKEETQSLFGRYGNRPPELIIQDELHLISSALGSIAGIYEAAISTVIQQKLVRPKYIASTATIKEATTQVSKLFAQRPAIFPPVGINADDSYFAKTVPLDEQPGRLYLGYLAPLLSRQRNLAPLAAALLIAPIVLFADQPEAESLLDAWWTMLVYHGSLKGVGNSHNSFNILVKEAYEQLMSEYQSKVGLDDEQIKQDPTWQLMQSRLQLNIVQLTSNATAQQNEMTFAKLNHERTHEESIDVALATNMVSVGLDVKRMALMVVNGQPITTAEYIQASSRVGRSDVPGIVVANYYRDQNRSLSHYENFRSYHQSFYRHVEPTSVTPYTYQARKRALHAGLVIVLRHTISSLSDNNDARNFDKEDPKIQAVIQAFIERCCDADPERCEDIKTHVEQLVDEWQYIVNSDADDSICYNERDNKAKENLLYRHGTFERGKWATLQSMRNVENTGLVKLI